MKSWLTSWEVHESEDLVWINGPRLLWLLNLALNQCVLVGLGLPTFLWDFDFALTD
jgi:hypothetical protein